jgi:hypothetical protein
MVAEVSVYRLSLSLALAMVPVAGMSYSDQVRTTAAAAGHPSSRVS